MVAIVLSWACGFTVFYYLIILGSQLFSFFWVREVVLRSVLLSVGFMALALIGYFLFSFMAEIISRRERSDEILAELETTDSDDSDNPYVD